MAAVPPLSQDTASDRSDATKLPCVTFSQTPENLPGLLPFLRLDFPVHDDSDLCFRTLLVLILFNRF